MSNFGLFWSNILEKTSLLHLESSDLMGFLKIFFQVLTPISIMIVIILLYSHASSTEKSEKLIQEAIARIEQKLLEGPRFRGSNDRFVPNSQNRNYVSHGHKKFGKRKTKEGSENQLDHPKRNQDSSNKE